jgi:hypothetical protein
LIFCMWQVVGNPKRESLQIWCRHQGNRRERRYPGFVLREEAKLGKMFVNSRG